MQSAPRGTLGLMGVAVLALGVITLASLAYAMLAVRSSRQAERDLEQIATHDRLTGLPNRSVLEARLETMLKAAASVSGRVGVIAATLNRFEKVNDAYGNEIGDALMIAAANQLLRACKPDELLVRRGGPEFVVLCPAVHDSTELAGRAAQLQAAVEVPYEIGTDHLRLTATLGATISDRGSSSARDLLADTTVALGQAYRTGNNSMPPRIAVFDPSMRRRLTSVITENMLIRALEREEFVLLYLPVVALDGFEIVGVEALLRWADPEHGLIGPAEFLHVLEDTGLIVPVGRWVLSEACRQACAWRDRFPNRELLITVNVSHRQLDQDDYFDHVVACLEDSGLDPSGLCLEINEGSFAADIDRSWTMLRKAKDYGIKLALDDFGVGYSSLGYLRRLQLDVLKIDRAFVQGLGINREDEAIVQQLVGLAHALDIVPIAEGVDAAEQADALLGVRCDFAQGYWFSRPQPPETITHLLERGRVTPGGTDRHGIDWSGAGASADEA